MKPHILIYLQIGMLQIYMDNPVMQDHYEYPLQSNHTIEHMLQKRGIKGRREIPRIIFGVISIRNYTRETYWRIHGRPTDSHSHVVSHEGTWHHHQIPPHGSTSNINFQHHHPPSQPSVEKGEIEALKTRMKLVEDLLSSSSSIVDPTSMANSGKNFILSKIFTITFTKNIPSIDPCKTWILECGATDHMTRLIEFFISYSPCPNNRKVQTADGTPLMVLGIGVILLELIKKLEHVLHVSQLFISLISVQKVTSLYPYKIEFDGLNAFLCNKVQGWKTGLAEVRQGLYYLSTHRPPQEIVRVAGSHFLPQCNTLAAAITRRKDKLRLIHRRLGHPSFQILRCMFHFNIHILSNFNIHILRRI